MKQEKKRCFSYQHTAKPWHLAAPIWCIHQRPGTEASFGVTVVPCGKAAIFLPYPSSWGSFCIPNFGFMAVYHLQPLGGNHEEFTLHPAPHRKIVAKPEVTTLFIILYQWKCMFTQIDPNSVIKCVACFCSKEFQEEQFSSITKSPLSRHHLWHLWCQSLAAPSKRIEHPLRWPN